MRLHIGIDDTDSTKGGCTTYIAACLVEKLSNMAIRFADYPNIVRLNPNIPYKTRGNAAVALRLEIQSSTYEAIRETVLEEVERSSHLGQAGTDPAAVFVKGKPSTAIRQVSRKALWDVLTDTDAMNSLKASHAEAIAYGSRLGLIGALAAIGQNLEGDHTYELVAYRVRKNWGTRRHVDDNSVREMDRLTAPETFNNYDFENERMLIAPHGPDPVLLGLRGETPEAVRRAFRMVKINEPVERWVIFRTNQGTEDHLLQSPDSQAVRPNRPVILQGVVENHPRIIRGGHVFFPMRYHNGTVQCAAFEPTGGLRKIVARLIQGDEVTVFGGVASEGPRPLTVNLEKIRVDHLAEEIHVKNPTCPQCGKNMKSAGKSQGFRCRKCQSKEPRAMKRIFRQPRLLQTGIYIPTPKAHRHLTKPFSRYGHEKKHWDGKSPSGIWHKP